MEAEIDSAIWLRLQVLDLAAYFTDNDKEAISIARGFEAYCRDGAEPRNNVRGLKRVEAQIIP